MIVPNDKAPPQAAPNLWVCIGLFDALRATAGAIDYVSELADHIAAGGMPTHGDRARAHQAAMVLRAIVHEVTQ